ncbi:6-phosphogluconolactonase [Mergibacter septicus]|uniref:6-phosphogluconolactonase n=1 Tax=Mergibacter septicus TaxID=221402 RepID=UPI0011790709|nr:6-phosphogluconolactonase [Mergibacter septicus]AWX14618.1 6-phosphogluconolactonase [Mergibacter septicus]
MNYQLFSTAQTAVNKIANELMAYAELERPVHISLSGGSTPKLLFKTLAQAPYNQQIHWHNLHFWWGDERCVPAQSEESNYGEVQRLLFDHIQIPADNIHRIRGENPPEQEVKRFSKEMLEIMPCNPTNSAPIFDWVILGMGTDGHTASLFPNQTDYQTQQLAVIATQPQTGQKRISKTAFLLEQAKRITYLVTGTNKAELLAEIESQPADTLIYPAAKIKAKNGITEWYLDQDAGKLLK